jgi:hypothetical protein
LDAILGLALIFGLLAVSAFLELARALELMGRFMRSTFASFGHRLNCMDPELKNQPNLEWHEVRGSGRITMHALLRMFAILLKALTTLGLNGVEKKPY